MARLPDGIVGKFTIGDKKTNIEIETKELILCKHCKYYLIDNVWCDVDGKQIIAANKVSVCKRFGKELYMTDPEGYCYLAEKDDSYGR